MRSPTSQEVASVCASSAISRRDHCRSRPVSKPVSKKGHERLRSSADVRAVFRRGEAAHGRAVVLHARDRGDDLPARWTVVAGRRVGAAVARNRAKRRLRAVLRQRSLPVGTDVVVVARRSAVTEPIAALRSEIDRLLARLGLHDARADG